MVDFKKKIKIHVYTDGSCNTKTGDMGIGIYAVRGDKSIQYSAYTGKGTNNIAELTAIKTAIEKLKKYPNPTVIYTDSQYCLGVLTKGYRVKANVDLVNSIKKLLTDNPQFYLVWVEGHTNCEGNVIADKIAVKARKSLQSE